MTNKEKNGECVEAPNLISAKSNKEGDEQGVKVRKIRAC